MTEATGTENTKTCGFCGGDHNTPVALAGVVDMEQFRDFMRNGNGKAPDRVSATDRQVRFNATLDEVFGDQANAYRPVFDLLGETDEQDEEQSDDSAALNAEELTLANIAMMLVALSYTKVLNDQAGPFSVILNLMNEQRSNYVREQWLALLQRNGVDPDDPAAVADLIASVGMRFSEVTTNIKENNLPGVVLPAF